MAAIWPTALQQKPLVNGFSYAPRDTTISTDMEYGPAKKRRRFTDAVIDMPNAIHLDFGEYGTLMDFYNIDLAGGVLPFEFTHPILLVPVQIRFKSPPRLDPLGGRVFSVSLDWEILP